MLETIQKIVEAYGVDDIDGKLEQRMLEGVLYAFQEQSSDDTDVVLNAFGTIVNKLGVRVKE